MSAGSVAGAYRRSGAPRRQLGLLRSFAANNPENVGEWRGGVRTGSELGEGEAEVAGETLLADAVEGGEGAHAGESGGIGLEGGAARGEGGGANGRDHEVLRGVLGGDELEDFRPVAGDFEQLRAEGVGDELGLPLLKDAVA